MLEPKELILRDRAGTERTFILHKFPAIAGREIITKYPVANMPKLGEYQQSEEVMLKLMAFVAVPRAEGPPQLLTTRALVDNHVGDWETLAKVEWAMLEYNCSFFAEGLTSGFFESIGPKVATWISRTLIPSLEPLLRQAKRASESSKPN